MSGKADIKLKICGMKKPDNLQAVAALQPDYLGFIFYPKSKRYMAGSLSPEQVQALPASIRRVGVFVNAEPEFILRQAKAYGLQLLQLHGDESPADCRELQGKGYEIIKAFGLNEGFDFSELIAYTPFVDYFLFDTKGPAYGGNGITFNWSVLEQYDQPKPFFLSGGIGLEEVKDLPRLKGFPPFAIDVNSRFETEPGLKNEGLLRTLKEELGQGQ